MLRPVRVPIWQVLVASCLWPLVIPFLFYVGWRRGLTFSGADYGRMLPSLTAFARRAFAASSAVALLLSLVTCLTIAARLAYQRGVTFRVVSSVSLVVAFFFSPWLVAVAVTRSTGIDPVALWVMPGVLSRAIPSVCALCAAATFYLAARQRPNRWMKVARS